MLHHRTTAGRYGTIAAKAQYTAILKEKNIEIVWQIPRSPETNLLDLGVWCSIQSAVEKRHRNRVKASNDALARTVKETWEQFDSAILKRVYDRWELVLSLIISDSGDNKAIDLNRGNLLVPLVLPKPESDDEEADVHGDEDDVLTMRNWERPRNNLSLQSLETCSFAHNQRQWR